VTLRDDKRLQRARLDPLRNSRGAELLTRPIDLARKWSYVTDVRLHKGCLVWSHAKRIPAGGQWLLDGHVARQAIVTRRQAEHDGRGILDEFLALSAAPDEAVLEYARTWGVLELCGHNLPACHEYAFRRYLLLPSPLSLQKAMRVEPPPDPRQCPPLGREPLTTWRFFAGQAQSMLNIAANLQGDRLGALEDWSKLLCKGVTPAHGLDAHRSCLRDSIEEWLKLGRVKPMIDDLTGALTWTGADLFGELAVQIALASKSIDGQVFCVACGKAYKPRRRVTKRGYNYCPALECQRQAAAQRAQRYRNRKKSPGQENIDRKAPFRSPYRGRTNDPLFSQ
jgi:hypothetical protein